MNPRENLIELLMNKLDQIPLTRLDYDWLREKVAELGTRAQQKCVLNGSCAHNRSARTTEVRAQRTLRAHRK